MKVLLALLAVCITVTLEDCDNADIITSSDVADAVIVAKVEVESQTYSSTFVNGTQRGSAQITVKYKEVYKGNAETSRPNPVTLDSSIYFKNVDNYKIGTEHVLGIIHAPRCHFMKLYSALTKREKDLLESLKKQ